MAARIAVMMSRLLGSLVIAPAITSSADCRSSIALLLTCAQPSVIIWLGWPGRLWRLAAYSAGDGKMLEPCGPGGGRRGGRAAVPAAAETLLQDG